MRLAMMAGALLAASACAVDETVRYRGAVAPPTPLNHAGAPGTIGANPGPESAATSAAPVSTTPAPQSMQAMHGPVPFSEPPPERTGVTFDWKETDPNDRALCKPGHYVGEYMCRLFIITTDGEGAFNVSGTVDMQLEQSTEGELLHVKNGRFTSATLAAIPVTADILGELNCSASQFEGRLENGRFSVALGLGIPFTDGTFSGPLVGAYEPSTLALRGTWDMKGELAGFPGSCMNGSWSVMWAE